MFDLTMPTVSRDRSWPDAQQFRVMTLKPTLRRLTTRSVCPHKILIVTYHRYALVLAVRCNRNYLGIWDLCLP
jgi:hypothetical protein